MKLEKEKIRMLETTWASTRNKGIRITLNIFLDSV